MNKGLGWEMLQRRQEREDISPLDIKTSFSDLFLFLKKKKKKRVCLLSFPLVFVVGLSSDCAAFEENGQPIT